MTNLDISFMLFTEIFIISLVSAIIGIIIQSIINIFAFEILGSAINISMYNFVVAIIISTVTSVAASVIPVIKIVKLHPVEIFKS